MSNPFADDDNNDNNNDEIIGNLSLEDEKKYESIQDNNNNNTMNIAYVPVVEAVTVNPFGDEDNNNNNEDELISEKEKIIPPPPPPPPKKSNSSITTTTTTNTPPPLPPKRVNDNQGMSIAARRSSEPLTFGIPNDTREKLPEASKVSTDLPQRNPQSGLVQNPFDTPEDVQKQLRRTSLNFDKVTPPKSLLPLSADMRKILLNGWELNAAIEALKLYQTSDIACQKLYEKGKQLPNNNSLANLWKPPLLVRVGSWLPNFDDQSTGYIVTVTIGAAVNISWQVVLRYSKFLEFYNEVYRETARHKVDIDIIQNKFPNDRMTNWLYGMTDDVRNKRKVQLDSWLRELFATPSITTIPDVYNLICYRFELNEQHIRGVNDTQLVERATFNIQDTLINPNRYKKK